jgi:hypothetical protein
MKLRVETALKKKWIPCDEIENRNKTRSNWKKKGSGIGPKVKRIESIDYFFDDLRNN